MERSRSDPQFGGRAGTLVCNLHPANQRCNVNREVKVHAIESLIRAQCSFIMVILQTPVCRCMNPKFRIGLFPSGKEQSGLPLGNNVFAVGVAEHAEGFKTSCRSDGGE